MKPLYSLFTLLLLWSALATGCGGAAVRSSPSCVPASAPPEAGRDSSGLLRANPGYIQWLERQSLLRKAPELTAIVTGSSLPWNAPSTVADVGPLLERADMWLDFAPLRTAWDGDASILAQVDARNLPARWVEAGLRGLFLTAAADSGSAWDAEGAFAELGRDAVAFDFAPAVGDDQAYAALETRAAAVGMLLGGEIPPSATGLGPDFFLAVRGVRDYPGLFLMVEVPADAWPLLPLSLPDGDNAGRPLSPEATAELAGRAVIPPAFAQDVTPLPGRTGAWAATPEIVGVDGVARRWVYRYAGTPRRPVLNWDDPSGAARRVLAAGIIRQVGLLHQPLVGLSVEALWGQDPAPTDASGRLTGGSPEPALSALRALAREVRRYGSWSLLRDRLPARLLPVVQAAGVDFAADTVLSPALEYALISGNAAPLKTAIDASLAAGVDHARLWRQSADGAALPLPSEGTTGVPLPDDWNALLVAPQGRLHATAPSLAAVAVGLTPDQARTLRYPAMDGDNADDARMEQMRNMRAAHVLQLAFRALQPGLLLVSGPDLSGALFATENGDLPPAWTPDGSNRTATRQGLPVAVQIYPSLDVQLSEEHSFASELRRLAELRRQTGVAQGRLVARVDMPHPAAAGVLTALPDGDYLLTAGNFSGTSFVTDVNFPPGLIRPDEPGADLVSGRGVAVGRDHLRLRMAPWQYRVVRLAAVGAGQGGRP